MNCVLTTNKSLIIAAILGTMLAITGIVVITMQKATHHKPTVIFDLDGVLFRTSKMAGFKKLGVGNVLKYTFDGNSPHELQDKAFEILRLMRNESAETNNPDYPTYHGTPLPSIMIDWQSGKRTNQEILTEVLAFIEKLQQENYFKNTVEKDLLINVFNIMFVPEERIEITKPIKQGIRLLEQYKAAGYQVYGLSNIDAEGYQLLVEKFPEVFKLFDGMITSCAARTIKPYVSIYTHLIDTYNLNPACCTFFDNEKENIAGALKVGIKGVLVTKKSLRMLNKKLQNLQALTI